MQQSLQALAVLALTCLPMLGVLPASAHETDNFNLPLDVELVDLGAFLETVHTVALEEAVVTVNAKIEKALLIKSETARAERLAKLHDPLTLAKAFIAQFGHPMFEDSRVESSIDGVWAPQTYAPQRSSYQNIWMNFSAHPLLDLRRLMVPTQSRTVKAYGVYFGTDKLVHFHHLGGYYYEKYLSLIRAGSQKDQAYRKVVDYYAEHAIFSEKTLFGTIATGVYSNADLAANHLGFKFFVNLTETVVLKGQERPPLLVRTGVFWRLNRHVRPRSGWLAAFISDHWNEALNPNRYDALMRPGIQKALEKRAQSIVNFYTRKDGRPEDPAYFDNLARELSTYYGENYGHCAQMESIMTIGNTCIRAIRESGRRSGPP